MKNRVILHCDCNSFFASVEQVLNPALANLPMAVAGRTEDRHGIILAKNELAKAYHIVTAETIYQARRKCPNLTIVHPHYNLYEIYSGYVREICSRFTDLVEPFGIDECFLDVTASSRLFGDGFTIAENLRKTIKKELGITVSVGVSYNKIFAKLGSDLKKPDAVTVITPENMTDIVHPLPVSSLLFVGKHTAEALSRVGVYTIGDLALASEEFLIHKFGKNGKALSVYARGEDTTPVAKIGDQPLQKSIGSGMTFRRDITTKEDVLLGIETLAEDVARRLRKASQKCSTIALTVKDNFLKTVSKQMTLASPTCFANDITDASMALFKSLWHFGAPVRALTVTATHLYHENAILSQMSFFTEEKDQKKEKTERLELALDALKQRFGETSVKRALVIGNDIGISDLSQNAQDKPSEAFPKKNI